MTTKKQFLIEHNRLSPDNLKATPEMLDRFRMEKARLFDGDDWPIEKIRRPFIFWRTSPNESEK